jgi:hypothetical protein
VLRPFTRLLKIPPVRRLLAPHQIRFVSKVAKLRTNCSGRRTGKTFAIGAWLTEEWQQRPGQSSIFGALTTEHAVRIIWDVIDFLNTTLSWNATYNSLDAAWSFPNGFTLYFVGLKDRRQVNHIRGIPKIHRVALDECGQIPDALLAYAVTDVIGPAMADTDGDICLAGTPADTGVGFYEDMCAKCEKVGAHFADNMASNPHLAKPGQELLDAALAEKFNGDASNCTYRREYLGERVQDAGVLVYGCPKADDFYEATPRASNYTTMGIDLGWTDGTGFCVTRSRAPLPGVHVVECYREAELTLPRIAAIAERMRRQHNVGEIFVDSAGGGGRTLLETLSTQYGLPCVAADKRNRRMRIEQVKSLLDSQTLRGTVGGCGQLLEEWRGLPWNEDRTDHRENWVDEATDALQYSMGGQGFSLQTTWEPELTPQEEVRKRMQQIQKGRKGARGGRR